MDFVGSGGVGKRSMAVCTPVDMFMPHVHYVKCTWCNLLVDHMSGDDFQGRTEYQVSRQSSRSDQ